MVKSPLLYESVFLIVFPAYALLVFLEHSPFPHKHTKSVFLLFHAQSTSFRPLLIFPPPEVEFISKILQPS